MDVIRATPPVPLHNRTLAEPPCCSQWYVTSSQNFVWLIMSKGLCVARVCVLFKLPEVYRLNTVYPLAYVDNYPTRSHRMENPNMPPLRRHARRGVPTPSLLLLLWKREHLGLYLVLPFSLRPDKLIFRYRATSSLLHRPPLPNDLILIQTYNLKDHNNFILRVRVISTFVIDTYCQLTFRPRSILFSRLRPLW